MSENARLKTRTLAKLAATIVTPPLAGVAIEMLARSVAGGQPMPVRTPRRRLASPRSTTTRPGPLDPGADLGRDDRLDAHHHAGPAPIRRVVDRPMTTQAELAQVMDADRGDATFQDPARDALR